MIDYERFIEDYNNLNITAHDVRRLHGLNSREYREIRKKAIEKGDIPKTRHMNRNTAKFYYKNSNGEWTVQKQYADGICINVGNFPDEETAIMIRDKCLEVNWDLDKIQSVIDENKIVKVKNYTLINNYWFIQKTIEGVLETFLVVKADLFDEETIKKIVEEFRKVNWDKNYTDSILCRFGIY